MRPAAVITLLFVLAPLAVSETEDRPMAAEVTGDEVRLRAGPSTRHAILEEVNRDDILIVIGREARWLRIRLPGGFPVYVHRSLLRVDPDGTAVVKASRVLMRVTAGKDLLPLESVLDRGDVLTVLDGEGEWVHVLAPDSAHLYIYEELARTLGPADEYRRKIAEQGAKRRAEMVGDRSAAAKAERDEEKQKKLRKAVLSAGRAVLEGEGSTEELGRTLREVSLETDDDLTRGYANALLALLGMREEVERLRVELGAAESGREEEVEKLRAELGRAEDRYREALEKARVLKALRENPYRAVGVIERREGHFVLTEKDRVLFRLASERFRLGDYVGRRVGVNGRMVVADPETGARQLMVEKLEIFEAGRSGR